jgi:anti-anti-sigma factor
MKRHPENHTVPGLLLLRVEASIMYFNAESILADISRNLEKHKDTKMLVLDLSSAPFVDVSGSKMLVDLANKLKRNNIALKIAEPLAEVREILRKQHMEDVIGHVSRSDSVDALVSHFEKSI